AVYSTTPSLALPPEVSRLTASPLPSSTTTAAAALMTVRHLNLNNSAPLRCDASDCSSSRRISVDTVPELLGAWASLAPGLCASAIRSSRLLGAHYYRLWHFTPPRGLER